MCKCSETKDNDFTWKDFQTRNNSELVAIFGNFVNRSVVLTHKYFGGKVPAIYTLTPLDTEALAQIPQIKKAIEENLENFKFREALKEAMNLARLGNKYLTDTEPWKVAKTDMDRVATILNVSLQICASLSIALEPFMPHSTLKLSQMLNIGQLKWDKLGSDAILSVGHQLNEAKLLFDKIEDDVIAAQIAKLEATKAANKKSTAVNISSPEVEPQKEECSIEDFMKMDIRTATVLEAERVPKTDKLLKLTIDTGIDVRTIVSGIAEYFTPNDDRKQVCILAILLLDR
jgi:methionyl-tRNA synthetase